MKQCVNCGKVHSDRVDVCDNCGSVDFQAYVEDKKEPRKENKKDKKKDD